jgi:hypothetical protein
MRIQTTALTAPILCDRGTDYTLQSFLPIQISPLFVQIIHDCKRDSEALFFQFGIKLHGVFDTQIAYSLLEELQGAPRVIDQTYISFVKLLEDKRYCGELAMGFAKIPRSAALLTHRFSCPVPDNWLFNRGTRQTTHRRDAFLG